MAQGEAEVRMVAVGTGAIDVEGHRRASTCFGVAVSPTELPSALRS